MGCPELSIESYFRIIRPDGKPLSRPRARTCTQKTAYSRFSQPVVSNYRYYSPQLGRWTNRDPIEELGFRLMSRAAYLRAGLFTKGREYDFCFNNPINAVDPLGLTPEWWDKFLEWLKNTSIYLCPGSEFAAGAECAPGVAKIAILQTLKDAYLKKVYDDASEAEIDAAFKAWEDAKNKLNDENEKCKKENCPCPKKK